MRLKLRQQETLLKSHSVTTAQAMTETTALKNTVVLSVFVLGTAYNYRLMVEYFLIVRFVEISVSIPILLNGSFSAG